MDYNTHTIDLTERILEPEDGLLLGNGDLSVSVYQTSDRIIWRFGKGDVWDRRLDLSEDPRPAHIDEVAYGIKVEGWKCNPYDGRQTVALHGTKNPKRMKELCQGCPPSYHERPYPCPKPVGELAMLLPPDQMGLRIHQRLAIEQATLYITCSWPSGMKVEITCFVPPSPNVLVVEWKVTGWNETTIAGYGMPPVEFLLYRWNDPSVLEVASRSVHPSIAACHDKQLPTLPAPTIRQDGDLRFIEQKFYPDPLFPDGFRYFLVPVGSDVSFADPRVPFVPGFTAQIRLTPGPTRMGGHLAIAVTTSSDPGGPEAEMKRILAVPGDMFSTWRDANLKSAGEFWSKSAVRLGDQFFEDLWYQTLHARRCAYRHDTVPPGLFLPSTVNDYSHWHGDYHTNYNIQSPFWGDYTANHFELGDAYFKMMEFMLQMGRKIARDYYNARGAFIQLSGFPIYAEDDCLGCVPMGRMAYMTGWMSNMYWFRYRYSMDEKWLREVGYPALRECALFYTDFMKKGDDGLYHAFPSNQGEDGFSGDPKDFTDLKQVMEHMRYCLKNTLRAAEILNADPDLQTQWRDILDHCAGDAGQPLDKSALADPNPPEFRITHPEWNWLAESAPKPGLNDDMNRWYCGKMPWAMMIRLRNNKFLPERDYATFKHILERWRHPNGLLCAMAIINYGHAGAWTETLGIIAPLQEMMLQSWDGLIRVFPAWPKDIPAEFSQLRAEGAFLVSASQRDGQVTHLKVKSLAGGPCRIANPWPGRKLKLTVFQPSTPAGHCEESSTMQSGAPMPTHVKAEIAEVKVENAGISPDIITFDTFEGFEYQLQGM